MTNTEAAARLAELDRLEAERRRSAPTHWGPMENERHAEAEALRAQLAADRIDVLAFFDALDWTPEVEAARATVAALQADLATLARQLDVSATAAPEHLPALMRAAADSIRAALARVGGAE